MKGRTARVIVTFICSRNCIGCCNKGELHYRKTTNIKDLIHYDEIVITGGEPMLLPDRVHEFMSELRQSGFNGSFYLYSSWIPKNDEARALLRRVEGFTYTLHDGADDQDIEQLIRVSALLKANKNMNGRLFIDARVYDYYDFSNIDLSGWTVIRKLHWKVRCAPAPNEDLIFFPLLPEKKEKKR